jgi:LacI family transcriptional regulator
MVHHLTSLGHRRIAFITGPEQNADAADRLRGYRDAVSEAFELDGDFTEEAGYAAGRRIVGMPNPPTAVFAANDGMAIGALSAFREARARVPEDIALAGFDDIPIARYVAPPLTTVNVAIAELGRRAFDLLVHGLANGDDQQRHEVLPKTLVIRESCGAASRTKTRQTIEEEKP